MNYNPIGRTVIDVRWPELAKLYALIDERYER